MNARSVFRPDAEFDAMQTRFARRVVAGLAEHADRIPADVSERLRFAREQALSRASAARAATAAEVRTVGVGVAALAPGGLPSGPASPWVRLASVLPLIALIAGLLLIQQRHHSAQIAAAAEIDAALLSDDLPPQAYGDAGFAEFLKIPRD